MDRKKNIFKLAQGEYVAAEKIENVLLASPLVAQAFVYGDSFQSYLVAVLVADGEAAAARFGDAALGRPGDPTGALARLCADRAGPLHAAVAADVERLSAGARLAGFEVVKNFILEPLPFSVEEGLLTPTFKLKRDRAQKKYQGAIDALYKEPLPGPRRSGL